MPRTNGGIIGKRNLTSFGKCTTTSFTSSGNICTQANTRIAKTLLVAGGGGAGYGRGGGGGAGGHREIEIPVCGSTQYPIVIGGGAAGSTSNTAFGANGSDSTAFGSTSTGGGGGSSNGSLAPSPASFNYGGHPGGSGGGSAIWLGVACKSGRGNTPPTDPPQGNPGGSNPIGWPVTIATGGGGGAGDSGCDAVASGGNGA